MGLTVFGIAGVIISLYVWYKQVTPGPVLCIGSGCATVIRSQYGRLLGMPNGALGTAYFLIVALTPLAEAWVPGVRVVTAAATAVALVLYTYLVYLQVFVIRALCSWCLTCAGLTAAIFWRLLVGT